MPERIPVGVISYNRPDYLRRTLVSLVTALSNEPDTFGPVYLFQDGSYSDTLGCFKTESHLIDSCCSVFAEHFDLENIVRSERNLGIGVNVFRAEEQLFDQHIADAVVLIEDDIELGAEYLVTLNKLICLARRDSRIGIVAAYGSGTQRTALEQEDSIGEIGSMHYNWAFAITRDHWRERRYWIQKYIDIIGGVDYVERPYREVFEIYKELGYGPIASNQDVFRNVITHSLRRVRITSQALNATFIGSEGEHFTKAYFDQLGFSNRQVAGFDRRSEQFPDVLSDELYEELLSYQASQFDLAYVSAEYLAYSGTHRRMIEAFLEERISGACERDLRLASCPEGVFGDGWCSSRIWFRVVGTGSYDVVRIRGGSAPGAASNSPVEVAILINGALRKTTTVGELNNGVSLRTGGATVLSILVVTESVPSLYAQRLGEDRRSIVWHLDEVQIRGSEGKTLSMWTGDFTDLISQSAEAIRVGF